MQQITVSELEATLPIDQLKNGSIFGALSTNAIDFLLSKGKLFKVKSGERIYDYGERGESFFIVCKGCLSFLTKYENECFHTRNINFGEESGFVSMISLQDHSGYAVAREDSIVLEVNAALFGDLHAELPFDFGIITLNLSRDMARTITKLRQALVKNSIRHW
jgi:CRP-like cAMP-binding protein